MNLNEVMVWNWLVAMDLFLVGAGAGAMLTSVLIRSYRKTSLYPIALAGAAFAGLAVVAASVLLFLHLGAGLLEPWRLIYIFTNPSSAMMWGALFITLFVPVALLYTGAIGTWRPAWKPGARVLDWARGHEPKFRALSAVLALGLASYTGFLLFEAGQGFPVWRTIALPALFFISAMFTGLTAAVAIGRWWVPGRERDLRAIMRVHLILIFAKVAALAAWLQTASASDAGRAAALEIATGALAPLFWAGVVFIGLVWPALSHVFMRRGGRLGEQVAVSGYGGVLVGGFLLRIIVLAAGVPTLARHL